MEPEDGRPATRHRPVLLNQVLELFAPDSGDESQMRILDCTLGGGGHSEAFLSLWRNCTVTGLDRDINAISRASARLSGFGPRFTAIHGSFEQLDQLLPLSGPEGSAGRFDRIIADFGFSSDQLDDPSRGFSFRHNGPLDMRLDQSAALSADTVVNSYPAGELAAVFRRGGVGQAGSALARAIVANRPIKDTAALAEVMRQVLLPFERKRRKKGAQGGGSDPATVPFQAIRIEVNGEFAAIDRLLDFAPQFLAPGGVAAMISFHSLEDQLVARRMRGWSHEISHGRSGVIERPALGKLLTPKAMAADQSEIEQNPRSRSARLRAFRLQVN